MAEKLQHGEQSVGTDITQKSRLSGHLRFVVLVARLFLPISFRTFPEKWLDL